MPLDPITMNPNLGGEETLLGILQRLRDLSQQPLVPQNPLAQLGTVLQGFAAGTQGQPNPALRMFAQQRQQQLSGLGTEATIGSAISSLAEKREARGAAAEKSAFEREKFRVEETRREKEQRIGVAKDLTKNPQREARIRGFEELQKEGLALGISPEVLADEPNYGFGTTDLGRAAGALYREALETGTPLSQFDALRGAKQKLATESTEAGLVTAYMETGLDRATATLRAREDLTKAGTRPPTSLEGEIVDRMRRGDLAGAERYFKIAQELALAKSAKVQLPKPIPAALIQDVQDNRFRAISWAKVLEGFDPSFVGLLGQLKAWSTKWSDLPGIPAFKARAEWAGRLLNLTQNVKKEMIGSARAPTELKDLARGLPDPDENLSVAQFVAALSGFTKGFRDYLSLLPDTMKQAELVPVDVGRELAALDQAIARLDAMNAPLPQLTPDQYRALRRQGFDDKAIIREGYRLP